MSVDLRKRPEVDEDAAAHHEYRWRVYRVELEAYDSRSSHPGSYWAVDVRALDPNDALERLHQWSRSGLVSPVGATARGTCRHGQPCFLDHRERIRYPEWRIVPDARGRLARNRRGTGGVSQLRRPLVWLGKGTSVDVVWAESWRADPAGEREPVLVWKIDNERRQGQPWT